MAMRLCEERGLRAAWLRIFSTYGAEGCRSLADPEHDPEPALRTAHGADGLRAALGISARTRCGERLSAWRSTHEAAGGIFNVGSPDAPPLRETVTRLRDLVDPGAALGFGELAYRPDQVMVLAADVSRMLALGWKPEVPLDRRTTRNGKLA